MSEGTSTPETIVATLEELKKAQDNMIEMLNGLKRVMEEIKKMDEEDNFSY